jgi:hypothetical protein
MKNGTNRVLQIALPAMLVLALGAPFARAVPAQSPEMQQRVAEAKEAAAKNKQELAQYTWVEQATISLNGEQKKQEHFQVRYGPDGKPLKTSLDPPPSDSGGHEGRLKKHVVEKKKEEYKEYADQIKDLIQQYVPPDKESIGQAYQRGNIMLGSQPGEPGQYRLEISNYIKQGDNLTLVMDKTQKDLVSMSIATYLSEPKDAVSVTVRFARIPDGPNHVSEETINGASKQLTIAILNNNYQTL